MIADEDHARWKLTDTALFRVNAPPAFLAPWLWPVRIWKECCK